MLFLFHTKHDARPKITSFPCSVAVYYRELRRKHGAWDVTADAAAAAATVRDNKVAQFVYVVVIGLYTTWRKHDKQCSNEYQ